MSTSDVSGREGLLVGLTRTTILLALSSLFLLLPVDHRRAGSAA